MVDLIVCVGDHCHLDGSEVVVRCFQGLLESTDLRRQVTLKGSFCCGRCSEDEGVTIRIEGEYFHTRYQDAATCFQTEIQPCLEAMLTGRRTSPAREG